MTLWATAKCTVCGNSYGLSDNRKTEQFLKKIPCVCPPCEKTAKDARIKAYKDQVSFFPPEMITRIELAAIRSFIIKEYGEEAYWKRVAEQVK